MNNNYYRGNVLVRRLVTCMDIVILNVLLFAYTKYGAELVPDYFDEATKITAFVANAALLLSEYYYSTIIHVRKIGFLQVLKRTLCLAASTTFWFFVFIRLLSHGGQMFSLHSSSAYHFIFYWLYPDSVNSHSSNTTVPRDATAARLSLWAMTRQWERCIGR